MTISFVATDDFGGSGVDYTEYQLDAGDWTLGDSLTVTRAGSHVVSYRSVDRAGNVEADNTTTVSIGTVQTWGDTQRLADVVFSAATHGWAVGGGGTILATTNGGVTWSKQSSGVTPLWLDLYDVAFSDAAHCWAVGNGGTILAAANGGTTWIAQSSGSTAELRGIAFPDAINRGAVGYDGTILATTTGGFPRAYGQGLCPDVGPSWLKRSPHRERLHQCHCGCFQRHREDLRGQL